MQTPRVDVIEVDRDSAGWRSVRVAERKEEYPPEWDSGLREKGGNSRENIPPMAAAIKLRAG